MASSEDGPDCEKPVMTFAVNSRVKPKVYQLQFRETPLER